MSIARALAGTAAGLLAITAAFHYTGYDSVSRAANAAGGDLEVLAPLLWLTFSIDLLALAVVAGIVAWRPQMSHRWILLALAIPPLSAAGLQMRYIGFIPPTAVLLLDVVVLACSAIAVHRAFAPSAA